MAQPQQPSTIRLIRFALLGGILLFGLVAAFLASSEPDGIGLSRPGPLASAVALLVILAAGAVMLIRRRLEMLSDLGERIKLLLVAHATCELAALLGAVHLMLTGGILPYVAGLTVFAFSLVLLPIERA